MDEILELDGEKIQALKKAYPWFDESMIPELLERALKAELEKHESSKQIDE